MGKPRKVERQKKSGKAPGWAPEIMPKHRRSLPNGRQQEPKGAARSAASLWRRRRRRLFVFHLVRISYAFGSFSEPVLARFLSKVRKSGLSAPRPNERQQGVAFRAAPRGRRFAPPPWGSCCLPFGKDFLCLRIISRARSCFIFDKICRF